MCSRTSAGLVNNPFYFVHGDFVISSIVQGGGLRRFMRGHLLCDLTAAAIFFVLGDPGGLNE